MELSKNVVADIELLSLFELNNSQAGLKIHHEASPERIASAERLFNMKLITNIDGGYLTSLGRQAADHAQALIRILEPTRMS